MNAVVGKCEASIDENGIAHMHIEVVDPEMVKRLERGDFFAINLTTYHRSKF